MVAELQRINANCSDITSLYSIGKSVEGRDLWVMEISEKPGTSVTHKRDVNFIGGIQGNHKANPEFLIELLWSLCNRYGDDYVTTQVRQNLFFSANSPAPIGNIWIMFQQLLQSTRLHILPSMNPDGAERAVLGDCSDSQGFNNAKNVNLETDFKCECSPTFLFHFMPLVAWDYSWYLYISFSTIHFSFWAKSPEQHPSAWNQGCHGLVPHQILHLVRHTTSRIWSCFLSIQQCSSNWSVVLLNASFIILFSLLNHWFYSRRDPHHAWRCSPEVLSFRLHWPSPHVSPWQPSVWQSRRALFYGNRQWRCAQT